MNMHFIITFVNHLNISTKIPLFPNHTETHIYCRLCTSYISLATGFKATWTYCTNKVQKILFDDLKVALPNKRMGAK